MAVLVVAALAFAGCAQDRDQTEEATEGPQVEVGELHGVVVDDTIQPLAGATVTAGPGDLQATTDRNGSFVFRDLDPGTYTLTATLDGYLESTVVGSVLRDRASPVVKIILPIDTEQLAFVSPYTFKGLFECGGGIDDITCSNVNIITWVVLGLGNVTNDRSLFLQWIDGPPTYLQTELVWESTQPLGDSLGFAVGGATEEQLSTGMATTHNYTFGPSPLVLTIPQPELNDSGIGVDRALLTQVVPAPWQDIPGGCVIYDPCGPGVQAMQPFETFTHAFYGFKPEDGWQFSIDGTPSPP